MHMADALISPVVGGALLVGSGAAVAHAVRRLGRDADDRRIPLMGVAGAFLFAAQMINVAIPGTGSSGHLAGGVLLAALVGPYAALLVMASVLAIQALLFADGGLLAYGCNLFNLGVIPAWLVYPLVYRPIIRFTSCSYPQRLTLAAVLSALVALQLGAFAVVIETAVSGIIGIPIVPFLMLMQPIHLAIGLLEAVLTAGVLVALYRLQPELFRSDLGVASAASIRSFFRLSIGLLAAALLVAGLLSWSASEQPDGLAWSLAKFKQIPIAPSVSSPLHHMSAGLQSVSSLFQNYTFGHVAGVPATVTTVSSQQLKTETSLSGIIGLLATLICAVGAGFAARRSSQGR